MRLLNILSFIFVYLYMFRNLNIEKRINERTENDCKLGINSYGGMGLDGISGNCKNITMEELNYMKNHPEIYNKNIPLMILACI